MYVLLCSGVTDPWIGPYMKKRLGVKVRVRVRARLVFLSDESLHHMIILKWNRLIKVSVMFQLSVQYSLSAWFLDGRTSIFAL